MKAIQVELPDKLAAEIEHYVNTGWFSGLRKRSSGLP
jgi:Arc/MetJ-type ribon-helix-helix transcriptional regulator